MTPNDVKIVADNIDDFIEVPNGVERLRKAVLVLAASGKLVPQDPKEGNAEKFYAQIQSDREKTGNGATGRNRKVHDFATLTPEEIPYQIPSSWKWVRLGEIIEFRVGKTPPRNDPQYWSDANVPWVSIADLNAGGTVVATKENINEFALEKIFSGYIAPKGTLLFSFKLTIGKMSVLGVDACHNEAIAAFFTLNDTLRDYLFKVLPAINTTGRTSNAIKGKTLNSETLALIEIPLPPLSEQKRIVEKVEEVMKQLDVLETKKRERDETRTRLARSAMQSLGKGESKIAFEQLVELVKTPNDLKELEGALLTLAVSGKLVPQDKKEGSAEDLYIQIQAERVKEEEKQAGLKRKIKDVALITQEEIPFNIPSSWKWVKLNQIGYTNIGLTYSPTDISDVGTPVLRSTNVQNGQIDLRELVRVKKDVKDSVLVQEGDLLICARNGSKALVGKTAMIRNLEEQMAFGAFMAIYRSQYNPYVEIFLKSPIFRNLLEGVSTTTINQITQDNLKNTMLPLPPLAEQERIVKKVEEVMNLVSQLRDVIGKSNSEGRGRPKK